MTPPCVTSCTPKYLLACQSRSSRFRLSSLEAAAHAPHAAILRMIGVEPASDRIEIYLRLPIIEPDDLRPLLIACGHPNGLDLLERSLPDGTQRLAARRLGFSLSASRNSLAVALFASARSLFPGSPEMLRKLIPAMALIPPVLGCPTLVTIRLNSEKDSVSFAAGVTINVARKQRLTASPPKPELS